MFAKGGEVYFMARLYFSSLVQISRLFLFSIMQTSGMMIPNQKEIHFQLFFEFQNHSNMQIYICE